MNDSAATRRIQVLERLALKPDGSNLSERLCSVARDLIAVTGAGISLITSTTSPSSVCNSDQMSAFLDDLQFSLGEGPSIDASLNNAVILESDLANPRVARWTAFSHQAVAAGARAVFGFPLRAGSQCIGALSLYNDESVALDNEQYEFAVTVADVAAQGLMARQMVTGSESLDADLFDRSANRWVVHQASGMVSVQLKSSVADALACIRSFAFAKGQSIFDVSRQIVERKLRFSKDRYDQC